jgi:murein DD-endopeptidase MepM/ murein hydrolase activator NlpD
LAEDLGLSTDAATTLLLGRSRAEWVAAAGVVPPGTLLYPVEVGQPWRGFGRVGRGRRAHLHKGVDIGAPEGSPVRATNDGIVVYADNGVRGYGNLVVLVHGDGTSTWYAHCRAALVAAGQRVARGDIIGEVGHTGLARGDHLHFEWHVSGAPADPNPRFTDR